MVNLVQLSESVSVDPEEVAAIVGGSGQYFPHVTSIPVDHVTVTLKGSGNQLLVPGTIAHVTNLLNGTTQFSSPDRTPLNMD